MNLLTTLYESSDIHHQHFLNVKLFCISLLITPLFFLQFFIFSFSPLLLFLHHSILQLPFSSFSSLSLYFHDIGYHIYTDGTQLYISFRSKKPLHSLEKFNSCISDIRVWMIKHKLKINDAKTEFIIFRSPLLRNREAVCQLTYVIVKYITIEQSP